MTVYQVLPAPVSLNDAAYIRQTGDRGDIPSVPRVLLPLPIKGNVVDLSTLRDPAEPFNPASRVVRGPVLIWVDLQIPAETAPGTLEGPCELLDTRGGESAGSVPVHLAIENLSLPVEPHLHFAAELDWQTLSEVSPEIFNGIPPRLLHRGDPRHAGLIRLLDACMELAHANKTDLFIPRLQPVVKWPLGRMPEVEWDDFDSVVGPWISDGAGFWPLPAPDSLSGFDLATQIQYWQKAAEHFDQLQSLERAPVVLSSDSNGMLGGPASQADAILMSAEARRILAADPRIGLMLPLTDDQLQLRSAGNPAGIAPDTTSRLSTLAPGLVSASPIRDWPAEALPPRHWIDATARGDAFTSIASEQGTRTLAWLAFARDASLVLTGAALPDNGTKQTPVQADESPCFYPGQWYGIDGPLATLQLKWNRQAEQDFEYLFLASQHNDRSDALKMCQLITRQVQLQPAQPLEPVFDLLAGSAEPHACDQARQLLAARMLRSSTALGATDPVELQTLRWFNDRQQPTLLGSGVQWMWHLEPQSAGAAAASSVESPGSSADGNQIDARVSVELYNPVDSTPLGSTLQWTGKTDGWSVPAEAEGPTEVPPVARYQVRRLTTSARFNLASISADSRQPVELSFVNVDSGQTVRRQLMLPVAVSERRRQPIVIDGSLDEWFPADAIQLNQPLVRMLDRPALQAPELQLADEPTSIFTGWSDEHFYLAFRLAGVTAADLRSTRNFVEYEHGRAWGEDLCELLIQPIYIDNSTGPTLHVVCKPGGNWVEQQANPAGPWQPFEASGVRYASSVDPAAKVWRGELAIPWRAIQSQGHGRPALLRFNFLQHHNSTGQSASWAGPIDQSRDGSLTGLLLLKGP
jgi:hypothetical protein